MKLYDLKVILLCFMIKRFGTHASTVYLNTYIHYEAFFGYACINNYV